MLRDRGAQLQSTGTALQTSQLLRSRRLVNTCQRVHMIMFFASYEPILEDSLDLQLKIPY